MMLSELAVNIDDTFLLELEDGRMVMVDISEEDDWGDIEPIKDITDGSLRCTIGKPTSDDDDERCEIKGVWSLRDETLNCKFDVYRRISLREFVARLIDNGVLFGQTDGEREKLKRHYGV